MNENRLAENLIYYRKKKGLSQEKVSEYLDVSRQAVSKWETGASIPSSDNLIKLARLFEIDVDTLLGNGEKTETLTQEEVSAGKMPWVFIGISVLCILVYAIKSVSFSIGIFICMFILCVPIQLFLHIYFTNAIKNNSFSGIAGFDDKTEYNVYEVKKFLTQLNLHVGSMSTVYIFLLCAINCANLKMGRLGEWLNALLIAAYLFSFIAIIMINNYKMINRIYRKDDDKRRAKRNLPVTAIYALTLCVGIVITVMAVEVKGIENDSLLALKICVELLLGMISATIGFVFENNKIKKWDPANTDYKTNKVSVIGLFVCAVMYGLICIA